MHAVRLCPTPHGGRRGEAGAASPSHSASARWLCNSGTASRGPPCTTTTTTMGGTDVPQRRDDDTTQATLKLPGSVKINRCSRWCRTQDLRSP